MAITAYQTSLSYYLCKVNIHVLSETGERKEKRRRDARGREVGKEESGKNEEERAEEFKMRERRGRKDRRETGGRRGEKRMQGADRRNGEWWSSFLMQVSTLLEAGYGRKNAVPKVEHVAPLRAKPLFQEIFIFNYFELHLID